jgi:hypothetical protein
LRLVTAYVCAVSRLTVSLVQPGSTQKEVLGSPNRPEAERQRGKEHVAESSDQTKICRLTRCKNRALRRELDCPKPNSQESNCPLIDTISEVDAILSGDFYVRSPLLLRDGR